MGSYGKVPEAVIRRMPKYYRYLSDKLLQGEERISSSRMSEELGMNASQIRRDLNCFGGFGQQGYGYSIGKLRDEIAAILGLEQAYGAVIIGAGNIGQALVRYSGFACEKFRIIGVFDVQPEAIGKTVAGCAIRHVQTLAEFARQNRIDLGIICTPKEDAQETASMLCRLGVRGIWNFAPTDVEVSRGVRLENVHLSDSLYVLLYHMKQQGDLTEGTE